MAIIKNKSSGNLPGTAPYFEGLTKRALSTRALLTALGDFWTVYYSQTEVLAQALSGHATMVSKAYTRILDNVLNGSINTVRETKAEQFELCSIDISSLIAYDADGNITDNEDEIDYYLYPVSDPRIIECRFLCATLFESPVVLEEGVHYEIEAGRGFKFYVDLKNDTDISDYCYTIEDATDGSVTYLFWACDLALSSYVIYERYGVFLYKSAEDGQSYHQLVSALMKFYANAKTTDSLRMVIDTLYGIPYARWQNETVTYIGYADEELNISDILEEPIYRVVQTDKGTYYTYVFATPTIEVGQTVKQFAPFATLNDVYDYINYDKWWEDVALPSALISGADISDSQKNSIFEKLLKFNTIYINITVTYQTFSQYHEIIKAVMSIVRSGIPVYVYPILEATLRDFFIDIVNPRDTSNNDGTTTGMDKMIATFDYRSQYSIATKTYNGTVPYNMQALYDHGYGAERKVKTYNGKDAIYDANPLDSTKWHATAYYGVPMYDGTIPYSGYKDIEGNLNYVNRHSSDREIFTITRVETRQGDTYDWEANALPLGENTMYNGKFIHNAERTYGDEIIGTTNEEMSEISAQNALKDTHEDSVSDSFTFNIVKRNI